MLEITNGFTALSLLKRSNERFHLFPNSEFVSLELFLMYGDIANLENVETRNIADETIDIKEELQDFFNHIKNHKEIRLWLATNNAENYLTLLLVLHLLRNNIQDYRISIIDVSSFVYIGKDEDSRAWDICNFGETEIKRVLKYEKILTGEEIDKYLELWDKLVKDNTSLRICKDKTIISVTEDIFDEIIFKELKDIGPIRILDIIGILMAIFIEKKVGYFNGFFFKYRIRELINNDKIVIIKKIETSIHKEEIDDRETVIKIRND